MTSGCKFNASIIKYRKTGKLNYLTIACGVSDSVLFPSNSNKSQPGTAPSSKLSTRNVRINVPRVLLFHILIIQWVIHFASCKQAKLEFETKRESETTRNVESVLLRQMVCVSRALPKHLQVPCTK